MRPCLIRTSPSRRRAAGPAGGRNGPVRRFVLAGTVVWLAAVGGAVATPAQRANADPATDWPPELGAALQTYRAGDYLETQRLCAAWLSSTRDERIRREAAALQALALMRMPARSDRLDGRARLTRLAEDNPALLERPECRLAYGLAQLALDETGSAIRNLEAAVTAFAARRQSGRLAAACVALARAWSRHNEWQVPLGDLDVQQPRNAREAQAIRRAQIAKLRARVAALPGEQDAVAQIDLITAQNLIAAGDGVAEGLALLERLAAAPRTTASSARACLILAQRYEQQRRLSDALRLYQRVQAADIGELSRRAARRADALSQPQLVLEVPATTPPGQSTPLRLRVRNLDAVQLEVRRVDLAGWLAERQGRFAEALLPVAGSVALAHELDTRADTPLAWWDSTALREPLIFSGAPGAYVAVARAVGGDGRPRIAKRLVLVSDLRAATFVGPTRALIWATGRDPGGPAAREPLAASFWMYGSFVPTRPSFDGPVARFALPPEAGLLRDRRWVCLVQRGEQLALCRGTLAARASSAAAVALVPDTSSPRIGQTLRLFGLLLAAPGESGAWEGGQPVQVDVTDILEQPRQSISAPVSPAGTFTAVVPITAEYAGEHFKVVVRRGKQVLENVRGRFTFSVPPADAPRFEAVCRLPTRTAPATRELVGEVRAAYPWGVPLAGANVFYSVRAVRLPTTAPAAELVGAWPFSGHGKLDAEGRLTFAVPLDAFQLPPGPRAVGVWARVVSLGGRQTLATAETLISPQPIHLWLRHEPVEPQTGEAIRFRLAWFDPQNRRAGNRPRIELRRAGRVIARLRMYADAGDWRSEPWRPVQPGDYEVAATLPTEDGQPAQTRDTLHVKPGPDAPQAGLSCRARYARRGDTRGIQLTLTGRVPGPLLVLATAADPLAAATLPELRGASDLFLPTGGDGPADARVLIATGGNAGLRFLDALPVERDGDEALSLKLKLVSEQLAPSAVANVEVLCRQGARPPTDVALLVRLIDTAGTGYVNWIPGPEPDYDTRQGGGGLAVATSFETDAAADAQAALARFAGSQAPSAELSAALYEGTTLWVASRSIQDAVTPLEVPIPPRPGRYRLIALARTPAGWLATAALALDARGGLRLGLDVPESLTVGDRSQLAVTLENPQPDAATARVSIRPGDGLHVETLRVLGGDLRAQTGGERSTILLDLAPGGRVRLLARVEATRAGRGTAVVELNVGDIRQRLERSYRVFALPSASPAASAAPPPLEISIRRTLLWLADEPEHYQATPDRPVDVRAGDGDWTTTPLAPGERLAPGQWLLIQDQFELDQPWEQVEWSQRLPAACVPPMSEPPQFRSIGSRTTTRLDAVSYSAARLSAGKQVHECPAVIVRPGAYRLPPPQIRVRGRPVSVVIEPGEIDVVVTRVEPPAGPLRP